jgi:hypothetical protein
VLRRGKALPPLAPHPHLVCSRQPPLRSDGVQGSVLCVFMGEYYLQVSLFRMGEVSRASAILERLAHRAIEKVSASRVAAKRQLPLLRGNSTAQHSTADFQSAISEIAPDECA